MKKKHFFRNSLIIAFIVWGIMIVKQQSTISQYKNDIESLSTKIEVANEELEQNKEDLKEEEANTESVEYIKKLAREKLGMYLQNERVYIDSNT